MPARVDLTGRVFGRLRVLEPIQAKGERLRWRCLCECGSECTPKAGDLAAGDTNSCGCLHSERFREIVTSHGKSAHHLYGTWAGMRARCTPGGHKHYGQRGIRVCERWNDFETFLADMEPSWAPGLTLERKDGDGPYTPENCVWATWHVQANNKRNNRIIPTPEGPLTLAQTARRYGVSSNLILKRARRGWADDRLLEGLSPI